MTKLKELKAASDAAYGVAYDSHVAYQNDDADDLDAALDAYLAYRLELYKETGK